MGVGLGLLHVAGGINVASVGLCAGRVGAMPLLVLGQVGQGVKRGLMGLQWLQLKTVIITLLCV